MLYIRQEGRLNGGFDFLLGIEGFMGKYYFIIIALAFVLGTATPVAAEAQDAQLSAINPSSAPANIVQPQRSDYGKYKSAIVQSWTGPAEPFVLDEQSFYKVQKLFTDYLRKREARKSMYTADDTVEVGGHRLNFQQRLNYLLMQGTESGAREAMAEAGFSGSDHEKMMARAREDCFMFAEDFWRITSLQMVQYAIGNKLITRFQLRPQLLHTMYGNFRGEYYNPELLDIGYFLNQAESKMITVNDLGQLFR